MGCAGGGGTSDLSLRTTQNRNIHKMYGCQCLGGNWSYRHILILLPTMRFYWKRQLAFSPLNEGVIVNIENLYNVLIVSESFHWNQDNERKQEKATDCHVASRCISTISSTLLQQSNASYSDPTFPPPPPPSLLH